MRAWLVVPLLALAPGLGGCSDLVGSNEEHRYPYTAILPSRYADFPDSAWATLLFLHGAQGLAPHPDAFAAIAASVEDFPFLVLMPDGTGIRSWNASRLQLVLRHAAREYRVDAERLYVTGLSMGGNGGWNLAADRPGDFAALVLIAGWGEAGKACGIAHLPVWLVHNRTDPVIPYQESVVLANALEDCGAREVRLTLREAAAPGLHPHNAWSETYRDPAFWSWLLEHRRPER